MSKRRINPATGEAELTYREQKLVDEYMNNGGNAKQAAIAAGYGDARAGQSAYQVLHRAEVQQYIRDRIAESRVSTEEIIGTLVSCMRGNLAQCFNEDGDFDIKVAKKNRLDHLLKTISCTKREVKGPDGQPKIVRTYRVQLHSKLQAASILGRFKGLDRLWPDLPPKTFDDGPGPDMSDQARADTVGHPATGTDLDEAVPETVDAPDTLVEARPDTRDDGAHDAPPGPAIDTVFTQEAIRRDFDPMVWLESFIQQQMRQDGISRSAAVDRILQVRPELALYLRHNPNFIAVSQTGPDPATNAGGRTTSDSGINTTTPRAGGRSLAALDSGPPPSTPSQHSNLGLLPAENRAAQPPPISTQDSRLDTPDSPSAQDALPTPDCPTKHQHSSTFARIEEWIRNLTRVNASQCLKPDQSAPDAPPLGTDSPTPTRPASP